jgi:glycosyltransferase involved in cell wall biosynthesis
MTSETFNTVDEAKWAALKDGPALSELVWDSPMDRSYGRFAPKLVLEFLAPILPIPTRRSYEGEKVNLLIGPPGWVQSHARRIDARTVIFTMNETTAFEEWVLPIFSMARAIVLPTKWGASHLSAQCRTNLNLQVCPLGVDTRKFEPILRGALQGVLRRVEKNKPFVFSTIADATAGYQRKGLELLIDAFRKTFPEGTNTFLKIRCSPSPRRPTDLPVNAYYVDEELSEADLIKFIRTSDAGMFPSRGEGFCLPALEYTACGVPIAVSDFGALAEVFPTARKINGKLVPSFGDYTAGYWFEPYPSDIRAAMINLVADVVDSAADRPTWAMDLHTEARNYSWEASSMKLRNILSQVGFLPAQD